MLKLLRLDEVADYLIKSYSSRVFVGHKQLLAGPRSSGRSGLQADISSGRRGSPTFEFDN